MSVKTTQQAQAYAVTKGLTVLFPEPRVSTRNPTTSDEGYFGQAWVNKSTGITFFMSKRTGTSYTWYQAAQSAASYTAAGTITAAGNITTTAGTLISGNGATVVGLTRTDTLAVISGPNLFGGEIQCQAEGIKISTATKGIELPGELTGGPKIVSGDGAPGALVAPIGSIYTDYTNGKLYVMGAAAWEAVTSA